MNSFLPFILIVISLAAIIAVIARKFPQLSLLDVESIPEVQTEQKKDSLLKRRAEERSKRSDEKRRFLIEPLVRAWLAAQKRFRHYVGEVARRVEEQARLKKKFEPKEKKVKREQDLKVLLQEGGYALEHNDLETAEKKYIAAVRLQAKSQDAYLGLGTVYHRQEQINEAIETLNFLLKLNPEHESALMLLAQIHEEKKDYRQALEYYEKAVLLDDGQAGRFMKIGELFEEMREYEPACEAISQAVELEPENPKYLDKLVEISVLCGDKKRAEEAYNRLRMANPENQKLAVLKDMIEQL